MNFEQQRKRAKDLLRAYRRNEPDAIRRVRRHHPRAAGDLQLADAQLVVAREAGFPSWARMKHRAIPSLHAAVRAGAPVTEALAAAQLWELREALEIAVERDDRDTARILLAHGAWVDHAGRRWGRWGGALHAALLLGRDLAMLEVLLDGGASLAARDREGHTPLAVAVRVARDDAAVAFRSRGARDDEVSDADRLLGACVGGERPAGTAAWRTSDHQHLCWAVRSGRVAAIPALLAIGLDPDVPDDDGDTALHLAVSSRAIDAVDALLAGHARVDAVDFSGETPLTRALRDGAEAIADRLRRAGAVPQEPVDLAELFEDAADAVVDGDLAKLAALLDREPRLVHARSLREHRCTLLHYVAANGVEDERQRTPANAPAVAELLLARGADPDAFALTYGGGPGQTPLALAITSAFPDQAGAMPDLVRALVRGGARVNGPDGDAPPLRHALPSAWNALAECGATIDLSAAASLGRIDRVRELVTRDGALQPGARLGPPRPAQEVKDEALLAACRARQTAIAAYLIDAGARIDVRGNQGMTGLHEAVWRCDHATVQMLIERGAPLEIKNDYGGTALDFAVWVIRNQPGTGRGWRALVDLLIAAGADVAAAGGRDAIEAALQAVAPARRP
jgi:ankyrin repeat protein